ncbi:DUF4180 domain-containing protein [Sphingobacterium sp. E70]|nr:DUF4180 domain-containing protein [Sphingobacterium sp. E70]ULT23178.1 DUF4180 domain-containing protein [Sphingobacterium sp. E70]
MQIDVIQVNDRNIAEVKDTAILINNLDDGLQIMVDCGAQEAYKAILYQENISADFFELKTKLAGKFFKNIRSTILTLLLLVTFPSIIAKV